MIDILAISHASIVAVNRTFYNRLRDRGWGIELVVPECLRGLGEIKKPDPPQGSDLPIHFLELKGSNPRIQRYHGIIQLLEKRRPKIVYLDNDPASLMACELGWWCIRNKAKLICQSCENLSLSLKAIYHREGARGLLRGALKNVLVRISRLLVAHVFVISEDGLRVFQEFKFRSVSKIPLGYPESIFHPDKEKRLRIRSENNLKDLVIAYFGRLVPEKGIHILIQALAGLKHLNWQLMMDEFDVNANSYSNEIQMMIDNFGLRDRVVFIRASHAEIGAYMNAADVVVLASVSTPVWKEQYGRVIPEAMACGKIVIAARSGALPELIANAGLLFEEGSVMELNTILQSVITSPRNFETYKQTAIERARGSFSVEIQVTQVEKIINKLK